MQSKAQLPFYAEPALSPLHVPLPSSPSDTVSLCRLQSDRHTNSFHFHVVVACNNNSRQYFVAQYVRRHAQRDGYTYNIQTRSDNTAELDASH